MHRIEPIPVNNAPLKFNYLQAYSYTGQLAKTFPGRVTWSEKRKEAAEWLKGEFRKMGYDPQGLLFSEVIAGKQYPNLEDVFAVKRGVKHPEEIMVAMAHYDVVETTSEGAMDDASGGGVVLELARGFSKEPSDRTIIFLITDSEEYGAFWGARAFAQNYPDAKKIVATANFDFVGPEKQTKVLTLCDGLRTGFTPLWLRELALNSLRSVGGAEAIDMTNFMEHVERGLLIPAADHGPFLAEGIPAFNWVGEMDNFPYEMAHYHHTPYDTFEAMKPESFKPFGEGAERLFRTIDALPNIPQDFRNSSYWKITRQLYLDGPVVTFLHILAFIPFLFYSVARFGEVFRSHPRDRIWSVLRNEAKLIGIVLGSLLLGYVVLLLLPSLKIITQYEAYPATQKSLLLYHPEILPIAAVIGSTILVYFIFRKAFAEPDDLVEHVEIRHALHAAFLAVIIILAFLKNSYLGTLLLLPPAYLWTALRIRKRVEDRILNGLLLLGGAITFVTVLILMATLFHIGVAYWYLFLAAAYGLISAYSVVLFFMALTILLRLFRAFVL